MNQKASVIAFYNMKGGVGKTTTATNISYLAAREGKKTLLIDVDPQGSASYYYRVKHDKPLKSNAFLKGKKRMYKSIKASDFENLHILPADFSYRKMDVKLNLFKKPRRRLSKVFMPFRDEYDYIIIDSPPNLTMVAESVYKASDKIVVPVIPTPLSLVAYTRIKKFFCRGNKSDKQLLAFFSMVDPRKKLHKEIMHKMLKEDDYFIKEWIPLMAEIERMGVDRIPVVHEHPGSEATKHFENLWKEIKKNIP